MRRLYEFKCTACSHTFEVRLHEPVPLMECPSCHMETARRVYTAPRVNNPIGGADFLNAAARGEAEMPGWSREKTMATANAMAGQQKKHQSDRHPADGAKRSYPGGGGVTDAFNV